MKAIRLPIIAGAGLLVAILLSYLANPILPVFVVTVIGLPLALFVLSRDPNA